MMQHLRGAAAKAPLQLLKEAERLRLKDSPLKRGAHSLANINFFTVAANEFLYRKRIRKKLDSPKTMHRRPTARARRDPTPRGHAHAMPAQGAKATQRNSQGGQAEGHGRMIEIVPVRHTAGHRPLANRHTWQPTAIAHQRQSTTAAVRRAR